MRYIRRFWGCIPSQPRVARRRTSGLQEKALNESIESLAIFEVGSSLMSDFNDLGRVEPIEQAVDGKGGGYCSCDSTSQCVAQAW